MTRSEKVAEILQHVDINEAIGFYGEERILDYLEYPPMACLKLFKDMVAPRTTCNREELKKLVCEWIDYNVDHLL